MTKTAFIIRCERNFAHYIKNKSLIHYLRDNQGRKYGVVAAFCFPTPDDNKEICIGWSKCNTKMGDKFNKYVGLYHAEKRSRYAFDIGTKKISVDFVNYVYDDINKISCMRDHLQIMLDRSFPYFCKIPSDMPSI